MNKAKPLELEYWEDPMTDRILVKMRTWDKDGRKKGIIINVSEDSLYQVAEGSTYPQHKLPAVGKPSNKAPVYKLGSADPIAFTRGMPIESRPEQKSEFSKGYDCISGVDTKVFIDDEVVPIAQSFSVSPKGGDLTLIIFDQMNHTKWLGKEVRFTVKWTSEHGDTLPIYDAKIRFDEHEYFGLSIDDILMNVTLTFSLVERYDSNKKSDK